MKRTEKGQAAIEMALILPFLLWIIINVVNFGALFYACITISNAVRAGADFMSMMGASPMMGMHYETVGGNIALVPITGSDVATHVKADIANLPNASAATVLVCSNNNGHVQKPLDACLATVTDPQINTSVVGQVTVQYTYKPLLPFVDFMGYPLTLKEMQIARTATTRLIQ